MMNTIIQDEDLAQERITTAIVKTDGFKKYYPDEEGSGDNFIRYGLLLPAISKGGKNKFSFTFRFNHNQKAGDEITETEETEIGDVTIPLGFWKNEIRYTDQTGRFNELFFMFLTKYEEPETTLLTNIFNRTKKYPLVSMEGLQGEYFETQQGNNLAIASGNGELMDDALIVSKDPSTIYGLNYEITLVPKDDGELNKIVIGKNFTSLNYLVAQDVYDLEQERYQQLEFGDESFEMRMTFDYEDEILIYTILRLSLQESVSVQETVNWIKINIDQYELTENINIDETVDIEYYKFTILELDLEETININDTYTWSELDTVQIETIETINVAEILEVEYYKFTVVELDLQESIEVSETMTWEDVRIHQPNTIETINVSEIIDWDNIRIYQPNTIEEINVTENKELEYYKFTVLDYDFINQISVTETIDWNNIRIYQNNMIEEVNVSETIETEYYKFNILELDLQETISATDNYSIAKVFLEFNYAGTTSQPEDYSYVYAVEGTEATICPTSSTVETWLNNNYDAYDYNEGDIIEIQTLIVDDFGFPVKSCNTYYFEVVKP